MHNKKEYIHLKCREFTDVAQILNEARKCGLIGREIEIRVIERKLRNKALKRGI